MFKEDSFASGDSSELHISVGEATYEVNIPENLVESNTCKKIA